MAKDYSIKVRENWQAIQRVTKDALQAIWIKAKGTRCRLIFEKDFKRFYSGYSIGDFEKFLFATGLFVRVHDSHIARKDSIIGYKYGIATLSNGKAIPVSRDMLEIIRKIAEENSSKLR